MPDGCMIRQRFSIVVRKESGNEVVMRGRAGAGRVETKGMMSNARTSLIYIPPNARTIERLRPRGRGISM